MIRASLREGLQGSAFPSMWVCMLLRTEIVKQGGISAICKSILALFFNAQHDAGLVGLDAKRCRAS